MLQKLKLLINIFLFLFLSKYNSYKINLKHSFSFCPNSLQEAVTINSNELVLEIDVFIPLGKNVKTLRFLKNFIELDISDIEYGIYFMNITINSNMYVFKISKDQSVLQNCINFTEQKKHPRGMPFLKSSKFKN